MPRERIFDPAVFHQRVETSPGIPASGVDADRRNPHFGGQFDAMFGDFDIFLALFGVRTHERLVRRHTAERQPVFERVATQALQVRHIDAVELLFQDFERVEPGVGGLAQTPIHRRLVFREMPIGVTRNGDRIPATRPGSGLRRLLRLNVVRADGQAGQSERRVFQERTSIRVVFHRRFTPRFR